MVDTREKKRKIFNTFADYNMLKIYIASVEESNGMIGL